MKSNKDLTVGKPLNVLISFCIPLFLSVIFQQLYNIADSVVAGNMIGENALSAISNSYEITLIFIAFAFGCNIGCSVICANFFGARDYKNVKTSISTSIITSLVICVILMLVGYFLTDNLLHMIKTPDKVFNDSKKYLDIYIYSLPFVFIYNISTGIFAALGDSKTPFYFLAVSSVLNVFMDILFVGPLNQGVPGTAIATLICQGIAAILALIVVIIRVNKLTHEETEKSKWFDFSIFKNFLIIAIPSILQQSFISVGNIVIQKIVNSYGTEVMAGYGAAIKLNNLMITSLTTLGNGVSNYTAQNIGAGKHQRVVEGFKAGYLIVLAICIPVFLLYMSIPAQLTGLFIKEPSAGALHTGSIFLRTVSPFYFVVSLKLVADGILRGNRKMAFFMLSTFTDLILRVVLAFVLSKAFGEEGIWTSWPIGWGVACILSVTFTLISFKKFKHIQEDASL
jgi:putative MATE family efflux protein